MPRPPFSKAVRAPSASMALVGLLFFLMGATIAVAGWASSRRRDQGEWVRHAHEVLEQTERTRARLYEAQEAEESREERLEGRRASRLEAALLNVRTEIDALDRMGGDAAHHARLRGLRLDWEAYEREMETLRRALGGKDGAAPQALPGSTKAFRSALRSLDAMRAAESRVVEARQAEWERAIRLSNLTILAAGATMALAATALFAFARREEASRRREREAVRERMEQLRDLSLRIPVAALYFSEGTLRLNEAARRLIGYDDAEVSTLDAWFRATRGERAAEARRNYEAERDAGFAYASLRRIRRKDGAWLDLEFAGYSDGTGEVWIFHDVTEALANRTRLEERNRALSSLAATDALTGLGNRRAFDERLAAALAHGGKGGEDGAPLSVLILDVDHFKSVNDRFGHDAGDAALREVAQALARAMEDGETAARYGGEEFAALLPGVDGRAAAARAERIRRAIEATEFAHGPTTVSVGVATRGPGATSAADLVGRADRALYAAKNAGRNRVCEDEAAFAGVGVSTSVPA